MSILLDEVRAPPRVCAREKRTVRAGDLAPDDADLGAADLLLATVDVGNALAVVEGGSLGVVDALDLDERGVLPQGVLGALERDVLAPVVKEEPPVSICLLSFFYPPCMSASLPIHVAPSHMLVIRDFGIWRAFLLGLGGFVRCGRT